MKRIAFLLGFFLLSLFRVGAQEQLDVRTLLIKMNRKLTGLNALSMKVKVTSFMEDGNLAVFRGESFQNAEVSYVAYDGAITVKEGDEILLVNGPMKTLHYGRQVSEAPTVIPEIVDIEAYVDSIIRVSGHMTLDTSQLKSGHYLIRVIPEDHSQYASYTMKVDADDLQLTSVEYRLKEGMGSGTERIRIEYRNILVDDEVGEPSYRISFILRFKNDGPVSGKGDYATYELIKNP